MTVIPLQLGSMFSAGGFGGTGAGALQRAFGQPKTRSPRTITSARLNRAEADAAAAPSEVVVDDRSDESLLGAYIGGDRAAFQTLMRRYDNELVHFLTRFLGSRAAADDVFQDTFLQIHLSAETFDRERRFKPWLFTIAANKARDYHRKNNRSSASSLSATIDSSGDGERFVDLLEADAPQPEAPSLDAERRRLVKKAVDSLPVHLREILLLSYFQGFSYNQIAESLEIPLGTVKSRLHTAVAAFARAWKTATGTDFELDGGADQRSQERTA